MASIEQQHGRAKILLDVDGGSPRSSRNLTSGLEAIASDQPVSKLKPLIIGEDGLVPVEHRGNFGKSVSGLRLVDGKERIVNINNLSGQYTILD